MDVNSQMLPDYITASALTRSATDTSAHDDVERVIQDLTSTRPAASLDQLLLQLDGADLGLRFRGVLDAALTFQSHVLAAIRSGRYSERTLFDAATTAIDLEAEVPQFFDRALFVFGVRRSGNHAVIEWLKGHFPADGVLFLNSAEPAFFRHHSCGFAVDTDKYAVVSPAPSQRTLIVSYENCEPTTFPFTHNQRIARQSHSLLVLRDYPNTAASIARSARDRPSFAYRFRIRDFPAIWCRYARLALAGSSLFRPILYNSWFTDQAHREALSRDLGLVPSDAGLERVSTIGGGSSFEGVSRDGSAQTMDVLDRWREMINDQLFLFLLLADDEALPLSRALFGGEEPTREALLARWCAG